MSAQLQRQTTPFISRRLLKLTVRNKNRSENSPMTSVTICIHDCNMFSVMYLSAPCLCCAFHGLGTLAFSWQMFGFLRFKWKINYCFIWEEFCRKLKYWLNFSHELTKKPCRSACRPHAWRETSAYLWPVQGQPLRGAAVVAAGLSERGAQGGARWVVEDLLFCPRYPPFT